MFFEPHLIYFHENIVHIWQISCRCNDIFAFQLAVLLIYHDGYMKYSNLSHTENIYVCVCFQTSEGSSSCCWEWGHSRQVQKAGQVCWHTLQRTSTDEPVSEDWTCFDFAESISEYSSELRSSRMLSSGTYSAIATAEALSRRPDR